MKRHGGIERCMKAGNIMAAMKQKEHSYDNSFLFSQFIPFKAQLIRLWYGPFLAGILQFLFHTPIISKHTPQTCLELYCTNLPLLRKLLISIKQRSLPMWALCSKTVGGKLCHWICTLPNDVTPALSLVKNWCVGLLQYLTINFVLLFS